MIERLADEVAKRVKPSLPLSVQLWNLDMIGVYLQRSPFRFPISSSRRISQRLPRFVGLTFL